MQFFVNIKLKQRINTPCFNCLSKIKIVVKVESNPLGIDQDNDDNVLF